MRKFNLVGLSVATVLALVGCGGGGSTAPETGTGYYVDAAVSGLTYVCGKETGKTDADGKFTFEVGKSCTFKVGDIELPIVEASELKDGATFVEDDAKTTQFLQSLDNAEDGKITITPKVIAVLKNKGIEAVPENDDDLKNVIKSIEEEAKSDESFTFTGHYVTAEEAAAHVEGTKAEIAATGAKFTFPSNFYADVKKDYNGGNKSTFEAEKFAFSADKKFTHSELAFEDGSFVLDENNDDSRDFHLENGQWVEESDSNTMATVVSDNDKVVTLNEVYQLTFASVKDLEGKSIKAIDGSDITVTMPKGAEEIKLGFEILKDNYSLREKAQSRGNTENDYYASLSEVVEVQCGDRYFQHAKEDSGARGIAFACDQENQTSGTLVAVKNDNSLVTSGVGTWEIKKLPNSNIEALLVHIEDKYRKHTDMPMYAMKDGEVWEGNSDTAGKKEPIVVYNQKAFDAITAKLVESSGTPSQPNQPITNSLTELIVGQTYYVTADNADTPHVETLQFNSDGHTVTDTWQENGETKTQTFSYSVTNDTLNISGTGADGKSFNENFNAPVSETNDYITFSGHDGKFYRTYTAAQAALAN